MVAGERGRVKEARQRERASTPRRFKPYPAYKDSGVEWLGEIPAHWEVKRLKRIFHVVNGATPASGELAYWDGDIPWVTPEDLGDLSSATILATTRNITEEGYRSCGTTLVHAGSLVLSTRAPIGHLALAGLDLCTNQGCRSLVFRSAASREFFFHELLAARPELESLGQGSTFRELAKGMLEDVELAAPPEPEQRAIAAFLDRETARIDGLVAKKERLIELLQEQRTTLITRAVTKGLDPNVPMNDSGVEWLGEIPAHWEVKPLKRVFANLDSMRVPLSGEERATMIKEYPYYGASGVIDHVEDYLFDEPLILVAEDGANLYSRSSPLAFVATGRYWVNNHAHILKPLDGDVSYWAHVLSSVVLDPWISGSAQPKLTGEKLGSIPLPTLPLRERHAIAAFLDRETARIDALVAKVRDAIERLKELRTALISAAVTGKIDVREEVA